MSDIKFMTQWALVGVAIGLLAFIFNYYNTPMLFPGYEVIAAPAVFALSFFS